MNARTLKSTTLAILGALAGLMALTGLLAPAALAAPPVATHVYAQAGVFNFRSSEAGVSRERVAVESGTGNILITDQQHGLVEVLGPGTGYLSSINTGGSPYGIAIDQTTGAVYVSNSASDTITRYVSDGAATPTYSIDGTFTSPAHGNGAGQIGSFNSALAVDPTTHDLLVADSASQLVDRYSSTGSFLGSFDGSGAPSGAFSALVDIGVAPDGTVDVIDGVHTERFNSAGVSVGTMNVAETPTAIAVDPTNGRVTVATLAPDGYTQKLHQFDAEGEPLAETEYSCCSFGGVKVPGIGIDGTSHRLYALSGSYGYEYGAIFELTSVLPGVGILAPASTGLTTAHLVGEVDPGGVPTTIRFEFSSDQGASWTSTSEVEVGAGNGAQEASLEAGGFYPGRSYLVRMVATNSVQHRTTSASTLTMPVAPPAVETGGSSEVEDTSAAVYGTLNPNGFQTTFYFEYGKTESYGSRIPLASDGVAGQGLVIRQFARTISGLEPQTTYHYRLVAQNSVGRAVGLDQMFTTAAASGAEGRVYEQVTPVHKEGGTIDSNVAFQAEGNGEGFVFKTTNTLGGSATESSAFLARYLSLRTPTGWTGAQPLDPPERSISAFVAYPTLAVSSDFTHSFVATSRALAPGAVSGDANLYIRDLRDGQYTFVGTSSAPGALNEFIGLGPANRYIAGAPDLSWIVFVSVVPLLPEAKAYSLYRWSSTAGLSLESVLPDGSPAGEVGVSPGQLPVIHRVSADGSRDFFAVNEAGGEGVYMRAADHTTALSVSQVPGDPVTPLRGLIMGASANGEYVVFASGRLTSDAPPSAEEDVYRYDVTTGQLQYLGLHSISTHFLVSDDGQAVYVYNPEPKVFYHGVVSSIEADSGATGSYDASPDGRYYAFSRPEGSAAEVYLYDAETRKVACVSCLPGGEVSSGEARLPDEETSISNRVPRAVNNSGQVFFDTTAKLVPADVNGMRDVYVYQAGKVRLISPGNAPFDARFADSSEDGSNVFFSTAQSLVGQDQDGVSDIYDARIGGGIPQQSEAEKPNCPGSECAEFSVPRTDSAQIASESLTLPAAAGGSPVSAVRRKVTVSVTKVAAGAASLRVSVRVSEKGRVRVSGSSLTTTARSVKKAGTYTLVVPLSAKAKAARRAHRRLKVKAKVLLTGSSGSATASISRTLGN